MSELAMKKLGDGGKTQVLTVAGASTLIFSGVEIEPDYICVCRAPGSVYNQSRVLSAYGPATGTLTAACTGSDLNVEGTTYSVTYTLTGGVLTLTPPSYHSFNGGNYVAMLFKG